MVREPQARRTIRPKPAQADTRRRVPETAMGDHRAGGPWAGAQAERPGPYPGRVRSKEPGPAYPKGPGTEQVPGPQPEWVGRKPKNPETLSQNGHEG